MAQARAAGVPVHLVTVGDPVTVPLGLDIAAYRIVQESLTNAAKHAAGATVTATIRYTDGGVDLEVADDGVTTGDRAPLPRGGHGLVGMREHVAVFGGAGPGRDSVGDRRLPGARPVAGDRMITVLLVDDHAMVRAGFRRLLELEDGLDVVAEAADGAEAVELATRTRPDVTLVEIRLPTMDRIEATRRITAACDTRVVILTTFDLDEYVYDALRAGASGSSSRMHRPSR